MPMKVESVRQHDALTTPRAALEEAKQRAVRKNKTDNLDLLWTVLMEIREAGGRDYSLSEVGRRLESKGGPKTQSLRNAGGADFRTVIAAFAHSVMGSPKYVAKTKSGVDQALDFIGDPSVRAVLKEEIALAKKYRTENAILRNALSRMSIPTAADIQVSGELTKANAPAERPALSAVFEAEVVTNRSTHDLLGEDLLEALQNGISKKAMRKNGWKVHDNGSVWNAQYEIFPPMFIDACQVILTAHGREAL